MSKDETATESNGGTPSYDAKELEEALLKNPYVSDTASSSPSKPLRICCYGSSSSKTPAKFLKEAWNLGYILAKRGHTCVNGAGSFGCMAAMNDGADAGNGHVVGVIHEMFILDGKDWASPNRDGGAHRVFGDPTKTKMDKNKEGPSREILVAGGHDLQERKRLLVQGAEGLIVLPGGPGTWDELWEMACSRNLGLINLPIVCISVEGYYDSFRIMLNRAYKEGLVKNRPEDVVHFVNTSEEAVRWIEMCKQKANDHPTALPSVEKRSSALRKTSFFSSPILTKSFSWFSDTGDDDVVEDRVNYRTSAMAIGAVAFFAGLSVGILSTVARSRK